MGIPHQPMSLIGPSLHLPRCSNMPEVGGIADSPLSFGKAIHRGIWAPAITSGWAVPAGAPSRDAHRALETIDVAVLVGQEAERQDLGAEIAVSLIEIPH